MERKPSILRRFRRDQSGLALLEFALIAPILIVLYFGCAEYSQALMAQRKAAHATSAIGDLVAQDDVILDAEMTDIFTISEAILRPFPAAGMKVRVSSVVMTSGQAKVDWSSAHNWTGRAKGSVVSLPSGLITADGQSVIMSEAAYTYDSPIGQFIEDVRTFDSTFYLRPRRSTVVQRRAS